MLIIKILNLYSLGIEYRLYGNKAQTGSNLDLLQRIYKKFKTYPCILKLEYLSLDDLNIDFPLFKKFF